MAGALCVARAVVGSLGAAPIAIAFVSVNVLVGAAHAQPGCFDDQSLQAAQQRGDSALIYVWSPRMVLSATEAGHVRQSAAEQGLDFWPLHASNLPEPERLAAIAHLQQRELDSVPAPLGLSAEPSAELAAKAQAEPASLSTSSSSNSAAQVLQGSRPLCAASLLALEATRHFPTAFVLSHGQLQPYPIVGAMPATAWQVALRQRHTAPLEPLAQSQQQPKVQP
jgi:hypothetical protein